MAVAPWRFDTAPRATRAPHVLLVTFSAGPLRDAGPLSPERHGAPGTDALAALQLRAIPRAADPRWFDRWRGGALRAIATDDLGPGVAALDAADHLQLVVGEPLAPADLGYLQAAWAAVRHAVERGATVVLDVHAARFRAAADVPPPGPLAIDDEVRVVFEAPDDAAADRAHAIHTRGLRKFGAPDLVALCRRSDARLVGAVMRRVADGVARGADLALPRHPIALDDLTTWYAVADEHRLADLLHLENAARVLVDERGHDLVGVAPPAAPN